MPLGVGAGIVVALVALAFFVRGHGYSLYDDAYIYFRYVENLTAGCGLRFTCGEPPVEGFTSPLYLMVLAAARVVTSDLETASQILGAGFLVAALGLTVATSLHPRLRSSSSRVAALTAVGITAIFAFDHHLLLNAVSGLETSLACLAVALVFRLSLDERPPLAAALLAILVRPELAVLVVGLMVWPDARRARPVAAVAVALLLMTGVRWLLFRDLLPNTFWAKSGGTTRHLLLGAGYTYDTVCEFPILLLSPLALLVERRAVGAFLIAGALGFAFFLYSGGDSFLYGRLAAPFVPTLAMLAMLGLGRALERLRPAAATVGLPAIAAALALHAWLAHSLPPQHGFENVSRWKAVGGWLARAHPGARIATVPIGAIGYFSRLPLIDLVGLTNREVARGERVPIQMLTRTWIGHEKQNSEWVLRQKPELLVFTKWRDRPWTVEDARAGFWAEWQLLDAIKRGRAPYTVEPAEIAPGVHWLVFRYNGS